MEIGGRFPGEDSAIGGALASAHRAIDDLRKLLPETADDELLELVPELEVVARRLRAMQLDGTGEVAKRGLHGRDGHGTPRIFERHVSRLSGAEAAARDKTRRACNGLSAVKDAYEAGEIASAHADLIGRVFANERVIDAMADRQARILADARSMSYRRFERELRAWERLADQDGAEPAADRTHRSRDARLVQDFNNSWLLRGSFGSLQGAQMADTFARYVEAELLADWEEAVREFGDGATEDQLPRTAAQRRADALERVFADAAAYDGSPVPANTVHTIVWSSEAFEEMVRRLDPSVDPIPFDPDSFLCETIDGVPLDPVDAFADALVSSFRRAVVDAKGVVVDLGTARLFTGGARAAVQLQAAECVWPGCDRPTSRCQADHLKPHAGGGRTHPGNGAPLCGRHNRLKTTGKYQVWKDGHGNWHTESANGRAIE